MRPHLKIRRAGGRIAAAAFALCLAAGFATGAQAADGNEGKWYLGVNVPVMFIDNTKTNFRGTSHTVAAPTATSHYRSSAVSSYGLGFRVGGVVGYYVLPNFRIEGELFYGFARVKKTVYNGLQVSQPGTTDLNSIPLKVTQPIKGNAKMLGGMANAWYDIPTGSDWSPFIGGGIGFFQVDFGDLKWDLNQVQREIAIAGAIALDPNFDPTNPTQLNPLLQNLTPTPRPADKDLVFAFQVGGGVGYRIDDSLTIQMSYKYQMAPGLQFDGKNSFNNTVKTKTSMRIHLFEVGFRYHF
ncbi:MAG: outer membrane beta-barrel protein [Rhodospirillaceae bacterium]|nr:outer membrane beta-barrel protein [Rhodospirillaceae bacterium]